MWTGYGICVRRATRGGVERIAVYAQYAYQPVRIYCCLFFAKWHSQSWLRVMRYQQRRGFEIVPGRLRRTGVQERVRKFFRRRSGSPGPRRASIAAWVLVHTGTARASNFLPCALNSSRRARWSSWSFITLIKPRRCSGLRAAVNVVRSIARNEATDPIAGASGRFKDIINENCPLVRPRGRSALSKRRASARAARCTWRQRQQSRTRIVVS